MKRKNENGITLVSLIITVILLIMITYVTVSVGINISVSANFQNIQSYMILIQTKCDYIAHEQAIGENQDIKKYGTEITNGEYTGWYKLSAAELADIGIIKQKEVSKPEKYEDLYYVNYEKNDVAYVKGVEHEGRTFYKLSDILAYTGSETIQKTDTEGLTD